MTVQTDRTWQPDDVEHELRAAIDLVEKLQPPDDLRQATFNIAAQLLTQRVIRQTPIALDGRIFGG